MNYKIKMEKIINCAVMMFLLASCGSRSQRLMRTVDGAVDDYNNGDSSSIIILAILVVIIGVLWFFKQKDK